MGQMLIQTHIKFNTHPDTHPNLMTCNNDETKIVIVSLSQSRLERDNIRQTWAKALPNSVKLIFMIGKSENNEAIEDEDNLVQTDIDPQDKDFDFKQTLAMLSWLYKHCPRTRFVLKTTSDIFINIPKIIELVDQEMFASNRMYGELLRRMGPERHNNSKALHHLVSLQEWPWRYSQFICLFCFVLIWASTPVIL